VRLTRLPGRWLALLLALPVAGCLALGLDPAVIDPAAGARLPTTVHHGLFLTRVRIGSVETGPFLVDSGASVVVLDVRLADALRLRRWSERQHDPDVGRAVGFGTIPSLQVGPLTLRNTSVAVLDLTSVTRAFGERLAGVLGYPFFAAGIVEVDYARASVSVFDPAHYRLPPRGEWVPLVLRDQRPGLAVRLDGPAEGTFVLDTGSTATARLFREFVGRHGLLDGRAETVHRGRHHEVSGEFEVLVGTVGWVELAGHRFERPHVLFDSVGAPTTRTSRAFDGLVGQGLLRAFTVVFNYPESKVAFLRR
jgi:hypothetical protein